MKSVLLVPAVALLLTATFLATQEPAQDKQVVKAIKSIYKRLQNEQWKHNTIFIPGITFEHQKGLYSSVVKANIIDKKNSWYETKIRDIFHIDDNNMFVTNFILITLLEAEKLGQITIDEDSFSLALSALLSYKDKNFEDEIPIFNFWPQSRMNDSWVATPTNLYHLVDMFPIPPKWVQNILTKIGWGFFNNVKVFLSIFRIPADNDDSSVNSALAFSLLQAKSVHPALHAQWEAQGFNVAKYYERAVELAYRPFESLHTRAKKQADQHLDEIDPRTYRYLYKFIDQEYKTQQSNEIVPSLLLASTWLMCEETRKHFLVDMPLFINNVDISVNANYLFGLSKYLLTLDQTTFDAFFTGEIQQMYGDITRLLYWAIDTKVPQTRPDIALTYYPSVFDFYWFISRLVHFLENQPTLPHQDIANTMVQLGNVLRANGMQYLIEKSNCNDEVCFWDEFLGNYADKVRGEDRIFSTGLALNILLDTWTQQQGSSLVWKTEASQQVKSLAQKATQYIITNHGKKKYLRNAFFSGSVKTISTYPYFYPSIVNELMNGTQVDPKKPLTPEHVEFLKTGWKGFASAEEYEKLLNETWYGSKPFDFHGFNSQYGFGFPFWSSDSISYAISLLGLSKFNSIQ